MARLFVLSVTVLVLSGLAIDAKAQARYQGEANLSIGAAFLSSGDDNTFLKAGLETVHGVRINPHWFVGGGVGLRKYIHFGDQTSYYASIPVFAHAKYYFRDRVNSPYVGADIGCGIDLSGRTVGGRTNIYDGLYFSPGAGYNFGVSSKTSIQLGIQLAVGCLGEDWLYGAAAKIGFVW